MEGTVAVIWGNDLAQMSSYGTGVVPNIWGHTRIYVEDLTVVDPICTAYTQHTDAIKAAARRRTLDEYRLALMTYVPPVQNPQPEKASPVNTMDTETIQASGSITSGTQGIPSCQFPQATIISKVLILSWLS